MKGKKGLQYFSEDAGSDKMLGCKSIQQTKLVPKVK
jgi:hypothetical protein